MIKECEPFKGYKREEFEYLGKNATIIFPNEFNKERKWIYKTEYLYAFPSFEEEMLKRGYAIANIENETRWCKPSDTIRQANFIEHVIKKYNLNNKCMLVGMSCGGMQSIYLGALFPNHISCMYLDAPVVNRLSCPCNLGVSKSLYYKEMVDATGWTIESLINDRTQPLDYINKLISNKIPCFLICGDSDTIVPYNENGINLTNAYSKTDIPFELIIKKGCDHHPHGIENINPLVEFALKNYK